jgi:gas vesicle protein
MKALRFFIGLILGAFVGSAVTLLFAPKKGDEMRKLVKDEMDRMVTKGIHDVKEEITHQLDKVKQKAKANGSKKEVSA